MRRTVARVTFPPIGCNSAGRAVSTRDLHRPLPDVQGSVWVFLTLPGGAVWRSLLVLGAVCNVGQAARTNDEGRLDRLPRQLTTRQLIARAV
jgi:hypothetical protein